MTLIDKSAQTSQQGMNQLIPYTQPLARDFCDGIVNEIHKTRFTIRGFSYVYDIVEDIFSEPSYRRLQILACLHEIKNVSKSDLLSFNIDAKIQARPNVPLYVPIEENFFITVAINILRQTMLMTSHTGTGVITILVDVTSDLSTLVVDFISSELTTRKEVNLAIKNLVILRDFRSILKVE